MNVTTREGTGREVVVLAARGGVLIGYELDHLDRLVFSSVLTPSTAVKTEPAKPVRGNARRYSGLLN